MNALLTINLIVVAAMLFPAALLFPRLAPAHAAPRSAGRQMMANAPVRLMGLGGLLRAETDWEPPISGRRADTDWEPPITG